MASLPLSNRAVHVPIVLVAIAFTVPTIAAAPRPTLGDVPAERGGEAELTLVVREPGGASVPARVRIEGLGPTPDPDDRASGHLLLPHGRRTLALPPGFYRVTASRGPEHSIASADVALDADSARELTLELRRVLDPGEHVGCDFHVHAAPSGDSTVTLEDRVASLAAEGVRFAVATDHNHVTDYAPIARALALDEVLATAPGVEVTTWAPEFGHFNAWPLVPDPSDARGGAPSYQRTSPRELFTSLRALGEDVVVQINHPRLEPRIGYFEHARFDPTTGASSEDASFDVDAVEVWNGYELASSAALDRNLADWMALLARGHRLVPTGNSDSHDLSAHPAGYPRTYVRTGGAVDVLSVARAVRAGRVFVTSGPLLELRVDGGRPGDTIVTRGLVELALDVRAPAWMPPSRVEVWMQGALVRSEPLDVTLSSGALVARFTTRLEVHEPSFVIVVVRGEPVSSPLHGGHAVPVVAFTSPVWVTASEGHRSEGQSLHARHMADAHGW